ncbi:MAG: hypothetical protein R3B70_45895 [Polyangiaceae bacterium]
MMRRAPTFHLALAALLSLPSLARADGPAATPGYPEAVVQWGVQKDETCEDVAKAVYGSAKHASLVLRYNRVDCTRGKKLKEGQTLVLPASVTSVPTARLRSINPDVKARPAGGSWGPAAAGQPLSSNSGVNTLAQGRADIEFIDRTRVFLASNTLVIIYGTANQSVVSKTTPPRRRGRVRRGHGRPRRPSWRVSRGRPQGWRPRQRLFPRDHRRAQGRAHHCRSLRRQGRCLRRWKDRRRPPQSRHPLHRKHPRPRAPPPPAPAWSAGASLFVIANAEGGQIKAEWDEVKDAKTYRVELARDESFRDLIAREEVPGNVRSFRADKMPPGRYHLAVRAIDKDEYLGVAAKRTVDVVFIDLEGAAAQTPGEIVVSPYAQLSFKAGAKTDFALDDGPFGPLPSAIDLARRAPTRLRFRPQGADTAHEVAVRYTDPHAEIKAVFPEGSPNADLTITFQGLEGVDIPARVAPVLRITRDKATTEVPLALKDGLYTAAVPAPSEGASLRADIVDGRGRILGSTEVTRPKKEQPRTPPPVEKPVPIGFTTEVWQPSPVTGVAFWSPTARNAASAAVQAQIGPTGAGFRIQGSATGGVGPVGFDATLRSQVLGDVDGPNPIHDDAAWLGARARFYRAPKGALEAGLAARFGFPVGAQGPGERVELSAAVGGVQSAFTWLVNLGARGRIGEGGTAVPSDQLFLLAGGTWTLAEVIRLGAVLDAHVLRLSTGDADLRGGLTAQVEAGTSVYGALALRLSPWEDDGTDFSDGLFTAQLALGLRLP